MLSEGKPHMALNELTAGQRAALQRIWEAHQKREASDNAERFAPQILRKMRHVDDITQAVLADRLNKMFGCHYSQADISRLESPQITNIDKTLQLQASRYFRSRGHDAESSGASIHIPVIPNQPHANPL
jgi:hypothetical protein